MRNGRMLVVGATCMVAFGLGYLPTVGAYASSGVCDPTGVVCAWITNDYQGSDHVTSIRVYNSRNGGTQTLRWLVNQAVQASWTGNQAYPGHTFKMNRTFKYGDCLQGGIVNIARTNCWYAPS